MISSSKLVGKKKNWVDFVLEVVWGVGEMVDPLAKQQIRGPNQQISQDPTNCKKYFGTIFVGIFKLGQQATQLG